MLIDLARFRLALPEFTAVADDRLTYLIEKAEPYFDVCRWGDFLEDGVIYWVAHRLFMDEIRAKQAKNPGAFANAFAVTSKSVGDVSVGRDAGLLAKAYESEYNLSPYGQLFLNLRKKVGIGALAV